jgi:hypothetical protein
MDNPLQKENQYTTRPGERTQAPRTTYLPKETTTSEVVDSTT